MLASNYVQSTAPDIENTKMNETYSFLRKSYYIQGGKIQTKQKTVI